MRALIKLSAGFCRKRNAMSTVKARKVEIASYRSTFGEDMPLNKSPLIVDWAIALHNACEIVAVVDEMP